MHRLGDLIHSPVECRLVGLGGPGEAAQFADELQRRGPDLFGCGRRSEVMQRLYIAAHGDPRSLSTRTAFASRPTADLQSRAFRIRRPLPRTKPRPIRSPLPRPYWLVCGTERVL